jgi:protein-S-isoprenylcysteine O-methyltransferase Ste14
LGEVGSYHHVFADSRNYAACGVNRAAEISEALFRTVTLALLLAIWMTRGFFSWRYGQARQRFKLDPGVVAREGRVLIAVRVVLFFAFVAAVALYALHPVWVDRVALPLPGWLRWAGAALALASLPLLAWTHVVLGRYWSVNLRLAEGQPRLTAGPYRWVAHPMYTALFAFMIGLSLVSASPLFALPSLGAIVALTIRILREERMMVERFGERYREYRNRVGGVVPHA